MQTLDQQSSIAALSLRGVEVSKASPSPLVTSTGSTSTSNRTCRHHESGGGGGGGGGHRNGFLRGLQSQKPSAKHAATLTKHQETLCSFLAESAQSPSLSDVRLVCDDGALTASRLVLACASPKFLRPVSI